MLREAECGGHTRLYSQHSEAKAGRSEFEASLVYRVNSKTARVAQRSPVSKTKINKSNTPRTALYDLTANELQIYYLTKSAVTILK